ncbi:hypothetical protein KFK09_020714 [Dendrobium nobile]|uniref:Uncharacterized protein n=1 Tax=Dendrobium nobile TaxID=94219 RepID=A0A8T3ATR8_DENNO|nr:hypothetical protein KFK09_020714 [Dendrobium nobile]
MLKLPILQVGSGVEERGRSAQKVGSCLHSRRAPTILPIRLSQLPVRLEGKVVQRAKSNSNERAKVACERSKVIFTAVGLLFLPPIEMSLMERSRTERENRKSE